MHVHGSIHNVEALCAAVVKSVVLYRDLRDVAVSAVFYVRRMRWHPEYPFYAGLSVSEGLEVFARRTLVAYADWVRSWHENRDPEMSLELRYEELLADPAAVMTRVATHFQLDNSSERIGTIVEDHSFQRLSGRRSRGQEDNRSFYRKGIAGDWRNHFTPELRKVYGRLIGDFLMEFGYEQDDRW
jgi:hypothetical protein